MRNARVSFWLTEYFGDYKNEGPNFLDKMWQCSSHLVRCISAEMSREATCNWDVTWKCRDAFGLRHWANGAEKLPRAHFSENSAPVMAYCFPFGRTFWKWVRPTFHMFFIVFEKKCFPLLSQLVVLSIKCTMQVCQRQGKSGNFTINFKIRENHRTWPFFGKN